MNLSNIDLFPQRCFKRQVLNWRKATVLCFLWLFRDSFQNQVFFDKISAADGYIFDTVRGLFDIELVFHTPAFENIQRVRWDLSVPIHMATEIKIRSESKCLSSYKIIATEGQQCVLINKCGKTDGVCSVYSHRRRASRQANNRE